MTLEAVPIAPKPASRLDTHGGGRRCKIPPVKIKPSTIIGTILAVIATVGVGALLSQRHESTAVRTVPETVVTVDLSIRTPPIN